MTTVLNHFFVMFCSRMTSGLTVSPESTLTCSDETCPYNLINSVWPIKYRHDQLTEYVVNSSSFQKAILTIEKNMSIKLFTVLVCLKFSSTIINSFKNCNVKTIYQIIHIIFCYFLRLYLCYYTGCPTVHNPLSLLPLERILTYKWGFGHINVTKRGDYRYIRKRHHHPNKSVFIWVAEKL